MDIYKASLGQHSLWMEQILLGSSNALSLPLCVYIRSPLDGAALKATAEWI
jgi:hypothetical protein